MNPNKRDSYELKGSIHTLSIRSPEVLEPIPQSYLDSGIIKPSSRTEKGITTTTSIINPNKLSGELYAYSDFNMAFYTILNEVGIDENNYKLVRCDMRFDSFENNHYHSYQKLNRLLLSLLADVYSVRNKYRSEDLFTQQQLSIAIKSNYFEAENYDKDKESGGTDLAKSRFEVRSKKWTDNDIPSEFMVHWFNRWDKALKDFDNIQMRYNDELEKAYLDSLNAKPCQYRSLTDFLIAKQECIFTSKQMINLLSRFPEVGGVEKAKDRAKYHKKKYGIEYFNKADVEHAINEIKRATTEFFQE